MDFKNLTRAELAKILGKTTRTLASWVADNANTDNPFPGHMGLRIGSDRHNLTEVINWLMADAVRTATRRVTGTAAEDLAAANLRKALADAQTKELELARRKDELLDVADVERTWTSALSRFRSTLLGARAALAEDVLRLEHPDFAGISGVYDKVIYAALTDLSELKANDAPTAVEEIEIAEVQ